MPDFSHNEWKDLGGDRKRRGASCWRIRNDEEDPKYRNEWYMRVAFNALFEGEGEDQHENEHGHEADEKHRRATNVIQQPEGRRSEAVDGFCQLVIRLG